MPRTLACKSATASASQRPASRAPPHSAASAQLAGVPSKTTWSHLPHDWRQLAVMKPAGEGRAGGEGGWGGVGWGRAGWVGGRSPPRGATLLCFALAAACPREGWVGGRDSPVFRSHSPLRAHERQFWSESWQLSPCWLGSSFLSAASERAGQRGGWTQWRA